MAASIDYQEVLEKLVDVQSNNIEDIEEIRQILADATSLIKDESLGNFPPWPCNRKLFQKNGVLSAVCHDCC